ncbi:MAG: hypothetical protein WD398_06005 [Cyclobacteriaceae bacterium]
MYKRKPIRNFIPWSFIAFCGFIGLERSPTKEIIELGNRREIFVDNFLIENLEGTKLVKHTPKDEGPVIYFDKPWESFAPAYITVLQDGDIYRAYYRGRHDIGNGKTTQNTCYAESKNGINWEKPKLGIIEVNGSKANNVLLDTEPETHNFSPFIDKNPDVIPEQKYKAFGGSSTSGLIPYASPDGIHWTRMQKEGVIKNGWLDSQNVSFWSESEEQYVCYFRSWTGGDTRGYRSVSRAVSSDFIHWSEPEEMSYGKTPFEHIYIQQTSPYFRAPHIYVAIGARFLPHRQIITTEQLSDLKVDPSQFKGLSEPVFMTSRGGNLYDRTFMEAFIRPAIGRSNWSARTNYPALNVVQTGPDEMSVYVNQDYAQPTGHLHRYSMRLDGFTSLQAPYKGGTVLTKTFTFSGNELEVNFSTSAGGEIRIEIQDEAGNAIPGYSMEESLPLIGNQTAGTASWKGSKSVSLLTSKPVRLLLFMKEANLYSFQFRQ